MLRGTEGFDHYALFADAAARVDGIVWSAAGVTPAIASPGRGGFGKCLAIPTAPGSAAVVNGQFTINADTLYCGFGLGQQNSGGFPDSCIAALIDPTGAGVTQCSVEFNFSTGVVSLYRGTVSGGTLLVSSAAGVFDPAEFPTVELMATIDGTMGAMMVRIDGSPVVFAAPANTQSGANKSWGGTSLYAVSAASAGEVLIDDFHYNDTAPGPGNYPCDGWLGDLRVATLFAISNVETGWTPHVNTNWQEVSETAFDGDTTYNTALMTPLTDLFNLGALQSVVPSIVAVQIVGGYRQTAGAGTLVQLVKTDGDFNSGAVKQTTSSYRFFADVMPVNPTTGASWTLADINALQLGYRALS